ncbi:Peptidoglycan/LPS O-acetylase OafA/YrhL [Candidatus Methylobacter favarea]|uniref:Peptidoglycan/LPS O-acetylase OafA/YrhL n=1 Tax=Candidatus Methylobacter favarea TaxID=2707345 RepID=A0A8S0XL36_9GAMM|nr:acyltransferase [Candidatus Methylobacter favarea]CAA9892532.1 Peptidoglycan/LPS O-acetylase OafA/YrhL [Candidatus Methylobacter favarea]
MSAESRFGVLDGWRGISILVVLACHLLPIGPKTLHLNVAAGLLGMSLFFTLSGFLVTHFLLNRSGILDFLIRRLFRILPLAWLYILIVLLLHPVSRDAWLAHIFFYANYPPKPLIPVTDHIWSLCVEMHFYIGAALLIALFNKRGLLFIPAICIGITLWRVYAGMHDSVITHFRIDEILAGSILALIYDRQFGLKIIDRMSRVNYLFVLPLLLIACHSDGGFMNYFRPYLAALLIGTTLFNQDTRFAKFLENRILFYIASVSFALYVIHPLLVSSWLGSGDIVEKYSKRPLLLLILFICAHISTYYYEQKAIGVGKKLSSKLHDILARVNSFFSIS